MSRFVCSLIQLYLIILFVRAALSWFPINPNGPMAPVQRVLFDLTEPVMAPVRRVIPPAGQFDLSLLVISFALIILQQALCP